jgi:hypothetical protein
MSKSRKREEWLRDIEERQRNVVFPDTVNNEARFWRNIIEGKQRLTVVQRVGIGIFVLSVGTLVFLITFPRNDPLSPVFSWSKLLTGGLNWLVGFGVIGIFLLIFRLSQRASRK